MNLKEVKSSVEGLRVKINSKEGIDLNGVQPGFISRRIKIGLGVIMGVGNSNIIFVKHYEDQRLAAYSQDELELDGDGDPL